MRFSLWPSTSQPWADLADAVAHAEATGWDGIYVSDHFMGDGAGFGPETTPVLEATAVVAALAATTRRVRLGTLVLSATYRHPAVLANWAATIDVVSQGRLLLGVGAGWQVNEHAQYGIELGAPAERLSRLDEACTALRGLLSAPTTSLEGRYVNLRDARCEPKPIQSPMPLLVGGKGDRMLDLVAHHAQEWNMWGLPHTIAERRAALDRACDRLGRDPSSIATSCQALWFPADDPAEAAAALARVSPRAAVAGSSTELAEAVDQWRAVGVDEVIVPDFTLGTGAARRDAMDRILVEVASAFR